MANTQTAPPGADDSLVECALKVLNCPDPWIKAEYTYATVKMWRDGTIKRVRPLKWQHLQAPERPARSDEKVRVCAPGEVARRGKGGTLASRQAMLHSAVHIENWAVDLSWDVIARFGLRADEYPLPREFFDDFVTVAEDECRHFTALAKRLEETGSYYGAFAVHDGLWESAASTSHSLPARLAVEHCVHEARGLDVLPSTIAKFANNGDAVSAALLRDVVYPEEVSHCAAGVRWIRYLYDVAHGKQPPADPADGDNLSNTTAATTSPAPNTDANNTSGEGSGKVAGSFSTCPNSSSTCGNNLPSGCGGVADGGKAVGEEAGGDAAAAPPACSSHASCSTTSWASDAQQYGTVEEWFHSLVRAHFWGGLKPPFNAEARAKAGFGPEWYLPLATTSTASVPDTAAAAVAATASEATTGSAPEVVTAPSPEVAV